jgi:hypothetical protein
MYKFFRRNFQCGASPVDQEEFSLEFEQEAMFRVYREHAAHVTGALNAIAEHQDHGSYSLCCIKFQPRAFFEEHEAEEAVVPETWFRTIEEAWASRPRNDVSQNSNS